MFTFVYSFQGKLAPISEPRPTTHGYNPSTPTINHYIGKDQTQRLERTNDIVRQQTGRWHRRQNKFGKAWQQAKGTTRLVVSYFNWIWRHSRLKTTAV